MKSYNFVTRYVFKINAVEREKMRDNNTIPELSKEFLNVIFLDDDLDFFEKYILKLTLEEQKKFWDKTPEFLSDYPVTKNSIDLLQSPIYREIIRKIKTYDNNNKRVDGSIMCQKKKPVLKFNKQGLKALHFFTNQLIFPIVVAVYTEWEEQQVSYMCSNHESLRMNSEEICRWCIIHGIKYQVMYPLGLMSIVKNPSKYYKYIRLKRKIKQYNLKMREN